MLNPGSGSQIRGVKKHRIPDPTYFCIKAINKFCLLIPDPGGKKAQDPGSGSATLVIIKKEKKLILEVPHTCINFLQTGLTSLLRVAENIITCFSWGVERKISCVK
jgi:hypothetical protein